MSGGGAGFPKGVRQPMFGQIFLKTAWNEENGGGRPKFNNVGPSLMWYSTQIDPQVGVQVDTQVTLSNIFDLTVTPVKTLLVSSSRY